MSSIQEEINYHKEKKRIDYLRRKEIESKLTPMEKQRKKDDAETRKFFKGERKYFNIK